MDDAVAPGVIRVETHGLLTFFRMARRLFGRPVYWTGAYYVQGVLIDCGPPVVAPELLRLLEDRPVHAVVITHHHEDHMGGAPLLHARRGVSAHAHPAALPLLAHGFVQEPYRRLAWGPPPRFRAEPLSGNLEWDGLRLQPVETPGHSPDHVCFFEADRGWLFTGDLFLAERLRYLRADEDLDLLIASLETVARLPLREVLCAHRGPVRDGPAALRRKAEGLRHLREQAAELLRQGVSEREVTRRVVGREGFLTWFSLGQFSARNFVRAVARKLSP